jgi:DNA-binding MarR family transcriptional regulator
MNGSGYIPAPMIDGPCYCILLRKASRRLSARYDEALAPLGINISQFSLLRNIERKQPISLTELGGIMELDRSTIGRNTKVLERMGLVTSVTGEDQREALLSLSDNGMDLLEEATPVWENVQVELDDQVGEEASGQLRRLLEIL